MAAEAPEHLDGGLATAPARVRDERGTGLFPLIWGVTAFLLFLFLAVHVAINLYTTSTVTALGYDAARRAALAGGEPPALEAAEAWLRGELGSGATLESASWTVERDAVSLTIVVHPPDLLLNAAGAMGGPIERTFVVRIERERIAA